MLGSKLRRGVGALALTALLASSVASCGNDEDGDGFLADCSPVDHDHSVARLWNEEALDAIRRDFPAPTVHARNLFHLSSAMYDAWTAFDHPGRGWLVDEEHQLPDQDRASARA